nr:MAG TPA: hypothetical protein [Bacteriophage sp.]
MNNTRSFFRTGRLFFYAKNVTSDKKYCNSYLWCININLTI